MLPLIAIPLGILLGLCGGGSLDRLAALRLKYEVLLVVMVVAQGLARGRFTGTSATSIGLVVWSGASVALIACLAMNWRVPGAIVAAAGVLLNLDVVLLNVGMPIAAPSGSALTNTGVISASAGFYHLSGQATLLSWAGDNVILSALGQRLLLSAGDILLSVGVVVIVCSAMIGDVARFQALRDGDAYLPGAAGMR